MPLNKYACKCGRTYQHIGPYTERACPDCGTRNKPILPREIEVPAATETVDKTRGVKQRSDLQERGKRRSLNHSKIEAREIARVHEESYEQHGLSQDDPKMI